MLELSTASDDALRALVESLGAPAFRTAQLRRAAWRPSAATLADCVELPAGLRGALLDAGLSFRSVDTAAAVEADGGNTLKLLCRLRDGETVETVAMETPPRAGSSRRATVCVSTQVGCAVGCPFCATARLGLRRSCTPAEIVDQVRAASAELAARGLGPVTHVVYMGMGEPLANLEATVESLRALVAGGGISPRRITVSTSGLVPAIDHLAGTGVPVTLAVSLHAADDELRDRLVPVNRAHPIEALVAAASRYATRTGRRVSLEWCLIGGVNDSLAQARGLARIARSCRAHVNVIPMNHIAGSPWGPPAPEQTRAFLGELRGISATVRDTRGAEVDGACGQLRAALEPRRSPRPDGSLGPPRRRTAAGAAGSGAGR
ncbi:MAG TPA: 23S rRNA (adenine(2503)-C(2))-methyltransferase RlmN [Candidatus Dormibacteraeota bacterium]|nr:23S rRNA (adenine(2503)-C(2))-methyltransferase RlmN [Candidatus Dormibacteraeota bacterium]